MACQNHFSEISTNLVKFFEEGFLCDTVLLTKNKQLRAHSVILAAVSPVFRAAFRGSNNPGLQCIELSSFDSETVEIALHFIYTGKLLLSPHYTHVDNLCQLFGRLKDLGLEAHRLNGVEIRFQSDSQIVKKSSSLLKKSLDGVLTKNRKMSSNIYDSELQAVSSERSKNIGLPTPTTFENIVSQDTEEKEDNSDSSVISEDPAAADGQLQDSDLCNSTQLSETDLKFEDGCSVEENVSFQDSNSVLQVEYMGTVEEEFTPSELSSKGFGLVETTNSTGESKILLASLSAESIDVHVSLIGNSTNKKLTDGEMHKVEADFRDDVGEFCPNMELEALVKGESEGDEDKTLVNQGYYILLPTEKLSLATDLALESSADVSSFDPKKKFPCDVCGKLLTKKSIKAHSLIHTGERPFKCEVCDKTFTMAANLLRHNRLHTGLKPHLCHLCGKSFIQKVTLQDHLAVHVSEKKFRCSTCGKMFLKSKHLTHHNNEEHRVDGKQIREKVTDTDVSVEGEKSHLCDFCGKSFVSPFSLKQHTKMHLKEKAYQCSYCDKLFLTKQNLCQHILNHTGEKPYVCKICGIAYKRKHLLRWHEHIHTGEKPYSCNTCGKKFAYSCSLKVHTRTHTGERPYKCNVCGTSYSQSNHLKVHLRTHTGEKPFVCEHCGKAYKNRLDLRLHSARVHQINITKSRSAATNNWQ